jgi:hypothetical protein
VECSGQLDRFYKIIRKGNRPAPDWFIYKEPFFSLCPEFVFDAFPNSKIMPAFQPHRKNLALSLLDQTITPRGTEYLILPLHRAKIKML